MSGNAPFPRSVVLAAICFYLICLSSPLLAAESETSKEMEGLEEKPPVTAVISATKHETPLEKITRFVTVITREEIEKSGKVYVIDLLRASPGVTVNQSGPAGRTVGVFVRGTEGDHVIIMLDGVQINSPTTGTGELADLTTENLISTKNIDRIEILRGPQSTLYGSDAVGGVINIITKAGGKRGIHADSRFEYGTYRTFYETGGLSGQWDRFSFSGSGARLDTKGPGDNDGFEDTRGFGHGKIRVTENSDLDVAFHYYNALVGIEDGAFRQDPNRWNKSREQILNTDYTISLKEWWEQSFKYSFFHDLLRSEDPRNPGAGGPDPESSPFKLNTDRHTFEEKSHFFIGDFDTLTAGYEFEHTHSDNKSFNRIVRNHGWFAQNELTLWKIWTIVAGIRIDKNDFFGTEASPLVSSALWIEKTMTKIKGSFGKGFKAPSFNELFFPGFGNPLLHAEKSWGWDAGFEQSYWDKKGNLSAAYFHNSIDNLIEAVQISNFVFEAENIGKAATQGVELEHKITPWRHLTFSTSYTYTHAVNAETGKRLIRRPRHQGKVGLTYDFWKFHLATDWILVGDREDFGTAKNKGYTRLDVALFYDLTKYFQIYTRAENLTDDHYQEVLGFDNPGARFIVGVKGEI